MHLTFLGGANTVTGSRFLLATDRAKVLIDCGMFQGSPNEVVRNRVPFGFDAGELDAILLTHAHLDHCGYLPVVVRDGFTGPIFLTSATAELTQIVLLDSGRLQEEFAKRHSRWERRHPTEAVADDERDEADYQAVLDEARRAEAEGHVPTSIQPASGDSDAVAAETESAGESAPGMLDPEAMLRAQPPELTIDLDDPLYTEAEGHVPTSIQPASGDSDAVAAETESAGESAPGMLDPEAMLRAQPPELKIDLDDPLYTEADAERVPPLFREVRYGREVEVAPGITATFVDAGHIIGSAIIELRVSESDGGPATTVVFSGDLGRPGTPIISDPTPMSEADYVVVESTYGGREHEPGDEAVRMLAEVVRAVDDAGGALLIPSFAIGRTQEIVWELDRLIERGEIPELPLYLDSPMALRASDVYRRHPEFYDQETRDLLQAGNTPLDYPDQRITRTVAESKAIATAPRPYMIIASNGMLTGGRVVAHLRNLIDDPAATVLFVGYQGEGTLGAHLQAGAKSVKIDGQVREVKCRVRSISGFSAHADESELLDWLGGFGRGRKPGETGYPRTVFLVHGDPDAQLAIAPRIEALGFRVHIPRWREQVELGVRDGP